MSKGSKRTNRTFVLRPNIREIKEESTASNQQKGLAYAILSYSLKGLLNSDILQGVAEHENLSVEDVEAIVGIVKEEASSFLKLSAMYKMLVKDE